MSGRATVLVLIFAVLTFSESRLQSAEPLPLNVLYLARNEAPDRTSAFEAFLSERFQHCTVEFRDQFSTDLLEGVDVVLFDWSQRERTGTDDDSPLGSLEEWSTPIVLLGSAGLHMAKAWQVIGDAG